MTGKQGRDEVEGLGNGWGGSRAQDGGRPASEKREGPQSQDDLHSEGAWAGPELTLQARSRGPRRGECMPC